MIVFELVEFEFEKINFWNLRKIIKFCIFVVMSKNKHIEQDFIIDRLTNSIVNTISGDSFQTEISRKKMVGILIGEPIIMI